MRRTLSDSEKLRRDERRAQFREIVKRVANMTEVERTECSKEMVGVTTCEGHPLSVHNSMLVWCQRKNCTLVGGFRQWIKQGRAVRKGEHGMTILVPTTRKLENASPLMVATGQRDETIFLHGTVFDVSQTIEIQGNQNQE